MVRILNVLFIMSLYEIDLAPKISDKVMCVKCDRISRFGTPEEIFREDIINDLYIIKDTPNQPTGVIEVVVGDVVLAHLPDVIQKGVQAFIGGEQE